MAARRLRTAVGAFALSIAIAAGPIVGTAHAATLGSFGTSSTGYALRVMIDLRPLVTAVPALQPVLDQAWAAAGGSGAFNGVIDQYFIRTTSEADGQTTSVRSVLAEGLIDLETVEASSVGQTVEKVVQAIQIPSADLPLLDGAVGSLRASIVDGPHADGEGTLDSLAVGLPFGDALPTDVASDLLAQLTTVVDALTADLTSTLTGLLDGTTLGVDLVDGVSGSIQDLTGQLPVGALDDLASGLGLGSTAELSDTGAVTGALTGLLDVEALVTQITGLLNTSLLEGAIADITNLVNTTTAMNADGSTAVAESIATLQNLQVLGGLIDVDALNLMSRSQAAGVAGSASNASACTIADARIGGDQLSIAADGSDVYINGTAVPVAGDLVAQVRGLVDQVLGVLGIDLELCGVTKSAAADDGTSASQTVSGLAVEVAPAGLFNVLIDPTVETAASGQVAVAQPDEPAPAPDPLPRTGATAAGTLLAGLGLAGGAALLRRRLF